MSVTVKITVVTGTHNQDMERVYRARVDALNAQPGRTVGQRRRGKPLEFNGWPESGWNGSRSVPIPAAFLRRLATRIGRKAAEYPVVVITHSPVFLDQLRVLVAEGVLTEADIEVLRVTPRTQVVVGLADAVEQAAA